MRHHGYFIIRRVFIQRQQPHVEREVAQCRVNLDAGEFLLFQAGFEHAIVQHYPPVDHPVAEIIGSFSTRRGSAEYEGMNDIFVAPVSFF